MQIGTAVCKAASEETATHKAQHWAYVRHCSVAKIGTTTRSAAREAVQVFVDTLHFMAG